MASGPKLAEVDQADALARVVGSLFETPPPKLPQSVVMGIVGGLLGHASSPTGEGDVSHVLFSEPPDLVDLRPVKAFAQRLPPRHPFRVVMEIEPDLLSFEQAAQRAVAWATLLVASKAS